MAALFVLLLLGSGLIFMVQNQEPILLYFLGNSDKTALFSLSLPVGLWVISFIVLGMLMSLLLQGLGKIGQTVPAIAPRPAPRPRAKKPPKQPVPPRPPKDTGPPPPQKGNWDWENPIPEADDWDVEDTPRSPSRPEERPPVDIPTRPVVSEAVNREVEVEPRPIPPKPPKTVPSKPVQSKPVPSKPVEPPLRPEDLKEFEAPQSPKTASREGNIYSYTYREKGAERPPKSSKSPGSKPVYDADYRVINPPVRSSETTDWEDEEDWV